MASVNKVIIVGNLGRDPEVRYTPAGEAVANIAVATSFKTKDKTSGAQKELTEWHRIAFFGRLAEVVGQYLKKGASVYVEGHLQTRKYTDKDDIERYATDIIAEQMQMLGSANGAIQHADTDREPVQSAESAQVTAATAPEKKAGKAAAAAAAAKPSRQAAPAIDDGVPF